MRTQKPPPEIIYAYCRYYGFVYRPEPGGWAYCSLYKKHFPDLQKDMSYVAKSEVGKPAGERTCRNFEQ